jgi:hypothetical protein
MKQTNKKDNFEQYFEKKMQREKSLPPNFYSVELVGVKVGNIGGVRAIVFRVTEGEHLGEIIEKLV